MCNPFSRISNSFPLISNSFPWIGQLILSDCNLFPWIRQSVLLNCNSFPQIGQLFLSDCNLFELDNSIRENRLSNSREIQEKELSNSRERILIRENELSNFEETNYLSMRTDCTIQYNNLLIAIFENPHVPSWLSYKIYRPPPPQLICAWSIYAI